MSYPQSTAVRSMFGRIARRYDLANHLLSGGRDYAWRRRLVAAVAACLTRSDAAPRSPQAGGLRSLPHRSGQADPWQVLDLATGSGDVAFALSRSLPEARILGMDFCEPMLAEAGRKKSAAPGGFAHVRFEVGDGLALPLADASFDAATISFGLRNMADRRRSLEELRRVLRPGGSLCVLEFSQPRPWFRPLYFFYLEKILPLVAGTVTGDRAAYVYLNNTIRSFPSREALADEIRGAGFTEVKATPMTLGIVALHEARK